MTLLPAFGGHGMYGMNVHRAVAASNARVTGATVHFVNDEYDDGAIVRGNLGLRTDHHERIR